MGGWKNLRIIGWVRHNGEVDLKMMGGRGRGRVNPFQSNCGDTKLPPSDPMPKNTQQVKCIPDLAQDTFSFTFPCL